MENGNFANSGNQGNNVPLILWGGYGGPQNYPQMGQMHANGFNYTGGYGSQWLHSNQSPAAQFSQGMPPLQMSHQQDPFMANMQDYNRTMMNYNAFPNAGASNMNAMRMTGGGAGGGSGNADIGNSGGNDFNGGSGGNGCRGCSGGNCNRAYNPGMSRNGLNGPETLNNNGMRNNNNNNNYRL